MNETIVADTTARIFADLADPQTVNRASGDHWKPALWHALAEAGLPPDVTLVLYKMDFASSAKNKDRIIAEWKQKIER